MIAMILITGGIILMLKKKFFSKLVMMCMAFIMSFQMLPATVFAIDSSQKGKITVNGVEEGVQVHAYRLMDIGFDYEVQQPENPMYQWVEEVSGWISEEYGVFIDTDNLNAVEEAFSKAKEGEIAGFYDKLAVAIKAGEVNLPEISVTADDDVVVLEDLPMGNYFMLIEGGAKIYRPLTANVVPEWKETKWEMTEPEVTAKSSLPSITKTVTDGLKKDHADIGDVIDYELVAVIPTYPENATAKNYIVGDKLCEGLTLVEGSVKVYGQNPGQEDVLLENGYINMPNRPFDVFAIKAESGFIYEFDYDVIKEYESLRITYQAVLNINAAIGEEGNINNAFVDYNNNPYDLESWNTDSDHATVYTYGMNVLKVDEANNQPLSGAEFTLSKDGTEIMFVGDTGYYRVSEQKELGNTVLKVDGNGSFKVEGLDAGTYYLTEVKAPDGYVKLQNPVKIIISDTDMNGKVELEDQELEDGYVPVTVKNDQGFTLPVTGGMGTTVFNIAGALLIAVGLLLVIGYCRKSNYR